MTTSVGTEAPTAGILKAAVTLSAISLFLSGWALLDSFDDADFERSTEQRLACLELPGPNDCGADGR
jgi:hypothetical protein